MENIIHFTIEKNGIKLSTLNGIKLSTLNGSISKYLINAVKEILFPYNINKYWIEELLVYDARTFVTIRDYEFKLTIPNIILPEIVLNKICNELNEKIKFKEIQIHWYIK
jgi:hypothetical protein